MEYHAGVWKTMSLSSLVVEKNLKHNRQNIYPPATSTGKQAELLKNKQTPWPESASEQ
jgi:hypothetical protein